MSLTVHSYGHHQPKRPSSVRRRRMEHSKSDLNANSRLTQSSSHENCSCFVSTNPSSSSRHFENTLKVLDKKRNFRKTFSLSSIREESQTFLDLELEIADRLRELKEKSAISLSRLNLDEDDDGIIYFMSRDRSGSTNLKMRFVNSLSNLSTMIRNGINKINDNGKFCLEKISNNNIVYMHCVCTLILVVK